MRSQHPLLKITIGGINQSGLESGNSLILDGRDLIYLQDVDTNQNSNGDIWDGWQAVWRDVFIVDGTNSSVQVYNLTTHNLATPSYYAELKGMLIDAAMKTQKPYTFASQPLDVDGNGIVAPKDAIIVINKLNAGSGGSLPAPTGNAIPAYYDVDGNLKLAPVDALMVINALNRPGGGEGEGSGTSPHETIDDSFRADFAEAKAAGIDSIRTLTSAAKPADPFVNPQRDVDLLTAAGRNSTPATTPATTAAVGTLLTRILPESLDRALESLLSDLQYGSGL